jgi:hypothetical protein
MSVNEILEQRIFQGEAGSASGSVLETWGPGAIA